MFRTLTVGFQAQFWTASYYRRVSNLVAKVILCLLLFCLTTLCLWLKNLALIYN